MGIALQNKIGFGGLSFEGEYYDAMEWVMRTIKQHNDMFSHCQSSDNVQDA